MGVLNIIYINISIISLPHARPRGREGGRTRVPLPAPCEHPSPHLQRECGSAQHQRTIPPPAAASGRLHRRLRGGQGGQPPAFEPIYLNGRQRRVWRGRAAPSCANQLGDTRVAIPFTAGAAPIERLTTPPARPGLICSPATQLNRGAAIPPGTLPRGRGREAGLRGLSLAGNGTSGLSRASTVKHQYSAHLSDPGQQERLESP